MALRRFATALYQTPDAAKFGSAKGYLGTSDELVADAKPFEAARGSDTSLEPFDTNRREWRIGKTQGGKWPVYTNIRNGGAEVTTVVRHIEGDIDSLRSELMMVCESPCRIGLGNLELRGRHTWKVREFFESLGTIIIKPKL